MEPPLFVGSWWVRYAIGDETDVASWRTTCLWRSQMHSSGTAAMTPRSTHRMYCAQAGRLRHHRTHRMPWARAPQMSRHNRIPPMRRHPNRTPPSRRRRTRSTRSGRDLHRRRLHIRHVIADQRAPPTRPTRPPDDGNASAHCSAGANRVSEAEAEVLCW